MYKTIKIHQNLINSSHPPKNLFLRGQYSTEDIHVGIVGSRKPTREGSEIAFKIAKTLSDHRIIVISGLARGIDSAAHRGALSGKSSTIAVLPCGIESVYPISNLSLSNKIMDCEGGLISEYRDRPRPRKEDFLARNRIIAGLSDLLIVAEAGSRSGALNTARHALEMGVDVMAVPGSINNPQSVGTNRLISQGAMILKDYNSPLEYLSIEPEQRKAVHGANAKQQAIIDILGNNIFSVDELSDKADLEQIEINRLLVEMEIAGLIKRLPGNLIKTQG